MSIIRDKEPAQKKEIPSTKAATKTDTPKKKQSIKLKKVKNHRDYLHTDIRIEYERDFEGGLHYAATGIKPDKLGYIPVYFYPNMAHDLGHHVRIMISNKNDARKLILRMVWKLLKSIWCKEKPVEYTGKDLRKVKE